MLASFSEKLPSFPEKLSLAQLPTPLIPLDRFSESLGGPRIWVKRDDLSHCTLSGNKIRKLEFLLADALAQNSHVLITCGGVQSNHCRATALVAAQLGLRCHLILRGRQPDIFDGNTLLAEMAGAEFSFHSQAEWKQLPSIFQKVEQHYKNAGLNTYSIPTGASNGRGLWGYISAAKELNDDIHRLGIDVGAVLCATGSGGTHAGLAVGCHYLNPDLRVRGFAVCDSREYFQNKAQQDICEWATEFNIDFDRQFLVDVCDDYIGEGYGIASREVLQMIRLLARTEGLVLDPVYTGKAFYGMVSQIREGQFSHCKNIVFVHTGGVFGVFPQRDKLSQLSE